MVRIWRKPGMIMSAYVLLYATAVTLRVPGFSASSPQLSAVCTGTAIGAFLAWRVARGSSFVRTLMIIWTAGLIAGTPWSPSMRSGGLISLVVLASLLVQLALLVSAPVYERTRQDWADRPPSTAPLWPRPPWWMAAAAAAFGLLITLLSLGSEDLQSVPCAPTARAPGHCVALAQGSPVHFLSAVRDGNFSAPVIYKAAAVEDLAVWTVLSFAACYLIWLPSRRSQPAPAPVAAGI